MKDIPRLFRNRWRRYYSCVAAGDIDAEFEPYFPSMDQKKASKAAFMLLSQVADERGPYIFPLGRTEIEVVCITQENRRTAFLIDENAKWAYCSVKEGQQVYDIPR